MTPRCRTTCPQPIWRIGTGWTFLERMAGPDRSRQTRLGWQPRDECDDEQAGTVAQLGQRHHRRFDPHYAGTRERRSWQTPGPGERLADAMMSGTPQDTGPNAWSDWALLHQVAAKVATAPRPGDGSRTAAARPDPALTTPRWPRWACGWSGSPRDRACTCWRPRTTTSVRIRSGRRTAARAGARTEVLDGLGHWWMVQNPVRGAEGASLASASLPTGRAPPCSACGPVCAMGGVWRGYEPMAERNVPGGALEPCFT